METNANTIKSGIENGTDTMKSGLENFGSTTLVITLIIASVLILHHVHDFLLQADSLSHFQQALIAFPPYLTFAYTIYKVYEYERRGRRVTCTNGGGCLLSMAPWFSTVSSY